MTCKNCQHWQTKKCIRNNTQMLSEVCYKFVKYEYKGGKDENRNRDQKRNI